MPLDGTRVDVDRLEKRVESDVTDIFIVIEKETAEDIDSQNSQSTFRLDIHNWQNGFVQNRISDVFACFRVGSNLSKNIVHGLGGVNIVAS